MCKYRYIDIVKKWPLLFVPLFCLFGLQCAFDLSYNEEEYLTRPTNLSVTAQSGQTFLVQYYVENQESIFDGYNLYISRHSSGDGGGSLNLDPYVLDGSTPTLVHSYADYDIVNPRTVVLTDFMGVGTALDGSKLIYYVPFEAGVTYYFKIKAHSQFNTLSEFSNEVAATAIP